MILLPDGRRLFSARRNGRGSGFLVAERGAPVTRSRLAEVGRLGGTALRQALVVEATDLAAVVADRPSADRWARCLDAVVAGWPKQGAVIVGGRAFLGDGIADARLVVYRISPQLRALAWATPSVAVCALPDEAFVGEGPALARGLALFGARAVRQPLLRPGNVSLH